MSAKISLSSAGLQACALLASLTLTLHAQTPGPRPSFEVASIKQNVSLSQNSGNTNLPGGRIRFNNQRMRQIIRSAYGSIDIEVIGGPDWLDGDRWDIVAVAPAGSPVDAPWREMLKTLLEERCRLRAHIEQRERPIYGLVFARGDKQLGPGIHPTACSGDVCGNTSANTNGVASGTMIGTARTMAEIARSLSNYAGRRVFDRTGLDGKYDFELKWSEDVSLFTALPDQLGLKLDAQRAPVDVIVIDSVGRPAED
jgi:uncharacterized protein (TIGR03435 family)